MTTLKVGGATIGLDEAKAWAMTYLVDRPGTSAYPAYDEYPGTPGDAVGRQDLLAIALLNVSNNLIPVYYGLEGLLEPMNERLNNPAISGELALASSETLDAIVHLFGILEEKPTKHVQLTTLGACRHVALKSGRQVALAITGRESLVVSGDPSSAERSNRHARTSESGFVLSAVG